MLISHSLGIYWLWLYSEISFAISVYFGSGLFNWVDKLFGHCWCQIFTYFDDVLQICCVVATAFVFLFVQKA